jgi:neutral ceramidase
LVERISDGITQAFQTRSPAALAIGQNEVWGYTRNRSIDAYNSGHYHQDQLSPPSGCCPECRVPDQTKGGNDCIAIDPILTIIRVDRLSNGKLIPMAAFMNFAMHGTVVPEEVDLFDGDVHGRVERHLENARSRQMMAPSSQLSPTGTKGILRPPITIKRLAKPIG